MTTHLIRHAPDEVLTHEERAQRAAECACDFALSVHINAWHTDLLGGAMAFYMPGDDVGRDVADTILRCMPEPLHRGARCAIAADPSKSDDDHWLERPEQCLRHYRELGIHAALLEVGYMTHAADREAMRDANIQFGVLSAVLCGFSRARVLLARASYQSRLGG